MRVNSLYTILILCIFITPVIAQSSIEKIYLHPKAAGAENQSKFIDSIHFTPLDVIDGIEVTNFTYVQATPDYLLLTDYTSQALFLYTKDGHFVKKIGYKKLGNAFGRGYDEPTNSIVFFGENKNYKLTSRDQIKILQHWNNPRNKKYFRKYVIDLDDSSFSIQKETPQENDILRAIPLYGDLYWRGQIKVSDLYKDTLAYELNLYKDNKWVKGFFPYNRINEPRYLYEERNVSVSNTDQENIHFVTRPFCDTIYKMVNDSLSAAYQLILPLENSLPASFFTQPFKNKAERDNFRWNNGWKFQQIYSFDETTHFIYFSVSYYSNYESYIYVKDAHTTFRTKKIKPDSTQYNLQLLEGNGTSKKDGWFYKTQKAGDLVTFFAEHKDVPVPEELEKFLNSNPPATTPVIVAFKLKD